MTEQFLSLAEASKYTGKTRNSLRRFVEGITKPESHPDRRYVKPSPKEFAELHKNRHPFSWKVSTELLDREFKQEGSQAATRSPSDHNSSETISLLKETIGMLKTELDEKNKQISLFQERQRETNFLLKSAHESLNIGSGDTDKHEPTEEQIVVVERTTNRKEGSGDDENSGRNKKRSFWQKLNRPLSFGK